MPVEIGKIDRELKKLWEQGGEMMARASLINLAVYSEAPDSLAANTQIIAQITEDHACRAIVIAADAVRRRRSGRGLDQRALPRQPRREQARLLGANFVFARRFVRAAAAEHCLLASRFRSAVLSLVAGRISRPDGPATLDVGRSPHFRQPRLERFRRADAAGGNGAGGIESPCRALRSELDATGAFAPGSRAILRSTGCARAARGNRSRGNRFRARLSFDCVAPRRLARPRSSGWILGRGNGGNTTCVSTDPCGRPMAVSLHEVEGDPVGRCSIFCGETEFRVVNPPDADLMRNFASCRRARNACANSCRRAASSPVALMSEELMRGGTHRVYLRAVETVRDLL